jgi:hypothetical protein
MAPSGPPKAMKVRLPTEARAVRERTSNAIRTGALPHGRASVRPALPLRRCTCVTFAGVAVAPAGPPKVMKVCRILRTAPLLSQLGMRIPSRERE